MGRSLECVILLLVTLYNTCICMFFMSSRNANMHHNFMREVSCNDVAREGSAQSNLL